MPEALPFRDWLDRQIRRREWNTADFIRHSDIPKGTVYSWMKGTRNPGPEHVEAIADTLHLRRNDVAALLGFADPDVDVAPGSNKASVIGAVDRIDWENNQAFTNMALDFLRRLWEMQEGEPGRDLPGSAVNVVPIKP